MKISVVAVACFALGLLACDDSSGEHMHGDAALGASNDDAALDAPGRLDAAVQDAPVVDQRVSEPDLAIATSDTASDSLDAAPASMCAPATSCTNDLTDIGAADFSIAFTLTTTAMTGSGIISQRAICMHSHFWDIRMNGLGRLGFELDDQTSRYASVVLNGSFNDGQPHNVQVCRRAGRVYAYADGKLAGEVNAAAILGNVAPLGIGTTKCGPLDGTQPLVGTVTNVCIGPL